MKSFLICWGKEAQFPPLVRSEFKITATVIRSQLLWIWNWLCKKKNSMSLIPLHKCSPMPRIKIWDPKNPHPHCTVCTVCQVWMSTRKQGGATDLSVSVCTPQRGRIWMLRAVTGPNICRVPDNLSDLHVICLFVDTLWRVELFLLYTSYLNFPSLIPTSRNRCIKSKHANINSFPQAHTTLPFEDFCSNGKPYARNAFKITSHMFRFPVMWTVIWPPAMLWSWSLNLWWPWLGVGSSQGQCLMPG